MHYYYCKASIKNDSYKMYQPVSTLKRYLAEKILFFKN
ncbi:MAG: hypothetical protein BWZ11_00388 [Bacteroidetes bacterium ADurb.BinA395]|nr:MAG: hypothetical protein BWZ11_00388 [Bacteroidetes bacterium ADurb.BinA395]